MSKILPPKLLIVTPDVVGKKMAGPGMRYVSIARALSPYMPVTFAVGIEGSQTVNFGTSPVKVKKYSHVTELEKLIDGCDVIFCQFIDQNAARYAISKGKRIVYDLYNALPVETVGAEKISGYTKPLDKDREFAELLRYFRFCSQTGSYFVTSNERQRDYWLGFIMANQGILPSTLRERKVSQIIGLTPFGMDDSEPISTGHALRGHYGITDDDFVIIWAGGIWDWFDAETPIKAVAELSKKDPHIKLVFYGTIHPNSAVGKPKAVDRAQKLAHDLGVYGKQVIFHDEWVSADERANYLLDANIAISSHIKSLETHYAFRTRILDHLWARLPSIVTEGDWFADYIDKTNLGIAIPCSDVEATKSAILKFKNDASLTKTTIDNIDAIRDAWRWSKTTNELKEFLLHSIQTTPLISPLEAIGEPVITLTYIGFLKQTLLIKKLKQTVLWPYLRKIKSIIRR